MSNAAAAMLSGAAPAPAPAPAPTDGAAPAPVITDQGGTPITPPPAPAANEWYSGIKDENARNWTAAKGWKDPAAAAESAYNLEKLLGHDRAGKTLVLPDDKATPEQVAAFRTKLGVPEKPDGYKLPVPEGDSGEFAKTAATWFHEAGVPAKAAEVLAAKFNEHNQAIETQRLEAFEAQAQLDMTALKGEWGAGYDKQVELARRAATNFLPAKDAEERAETLSKIEQAIGTGAMMRLFAQIGSGLSEATMVGADDAVGFNDLTPAQAKARVEQLKSNKDWTAKYLSGDKAALAEMERLSKLAVGVAP